MNLKHYDFDRRPRFITICTHRRIPIFTNNKFNKIIIDSISSARDKYGFRLIAYTIMPEHAHLIVIPGVYDQLSLIIGDIKRTSAKRIHRLIVENNSQLHKNLIVKRNRVERFALWMRRCYDHNCRSEESLWQKVDYCHNNPVKRGLVASPEKYIWSSCRFYYGYDDALLQMDNIS